jgi:aminopeptidase N
MDLYFERCDGTAATIEDFIACFAQTSGRDLEPFMQWYRQAGTPLLTAKGAYDAAARTYTLDLTQSTPPTPGQPTKKPLVLPIALGLVSHNGGDIALDTPDEGQPGGANATERATGVFDLSTESRRLVFRNVGARPAPSLLRGFSAPVRLDCDFDEDDLLTLLRGDSDLFNRWQAAQTYATRLLLRSVESIRSGGGAIVDDRFAQAVGELVMARETDPAFVALTIGLPTDADIAREIGKDVDPDAIFAARKALKSSIGASLIETLRERYASLSTDRRAYSPDAASAGHRALRNAVLDLLAAGDAGIGGDLAMAQFEHADNMTDQIGALAVLAVTPGDRRDRALELFFRAHGADALVIDKWFALQATIPEGTLSRVRELMNHHAFSKTNPNRLRALVGTFAAGNPTQFHAADGSGYEFLAGIVTDLDPKNPQVAARLLGAFRSWRTMEAGRRERAEMTLRKVASVRSLSPDTRDIVDRMLA